jgi:hypothetical protein
MLATPGVAAADARLECIARCETPAAACMGKAHAVRDACFGGARRSCMARPPAEQFNCLSAATRTCAGARSSQVEACRASFNTCSTACGARAADRRTTGARSTSTGPAAWPIANGSAGTPSGENPTKRCVALLKDAPTAGYALSCDPLL